MARIRTIKPEFPHSESMGRVSRDARLLFIQLWTLCDDSGRTRAVSRMLASLLFPYDDDANGLIEGWLSELEQEGCIVRYSADGSTYLQVCNWLNHQKIDKPSQSKIPPFDESSRILANPRERSSEDQGSRIKDQGKNNGDEYTADFLSFWNSWPDGYGSKGAKAEAFREWRKARSLPSAEFLIAAANAQADDKTARKMAGEFVENFKHVCRWLKGREWENEAPMLRVVSGEVYR